MSGRYEDREEAWKQGLGGGEAAVAWESMGDTAAPFHAAAFAARAAAQPDSPALTWLGDKGEEVVQLSFAELEAQVAAVAEFLTIKMRLAPGDRICLSFPPGFKFLVTIMACFATGIVAVPVYPPNPASYQKDMARLALIAAASGAATALTDTTFLLVVTAVRWKNILTLQGSGASVSWKAVPDACFAAKPDKKKRLEHYAVGPDDVAFLQFTSGSTGDPKGVMVTHRALTHNITSMARDLKPRPGDIMASWMPQYHDFGLIVMMLYPTYLGLRAVITSPFSFLKDPLVWLLMLTKYRPITTASPNFGYTRTAKAWRALPEGQQPSIDLSSLRYCFNAAEPIRASTLREFHEVFGPHGFGPACMTPAYGLAEHVVYVGACWGLEDGRPASTLDLVDPDTGFVACMELGYDPDIEVLLMSVPTDEEVPQRPVAAGATGEIWLHSPSVAGSYWGRPDATQATFGTEWAGKRWLRTGDLGYTKAGYLYITGRLKDVIIVNGRNYYPQDVEVTVEQCSKHIRPGCVAAFQLATGLGDGAVALPPDRLGIVAEVRSAKLSAEDLGELFLAIRQAVAEEHMLTIKAIALVHQRSIPKTTSGKIRRSTCKSMLLAGKGLQLIPGGTFDAGDASLVQVDYVAPRNELEAAIQAAWMEVLGRPASAPISVTADFFAEGGTSLQVFQAGAAMEKALGRSIPPTLVHRARTIAQLAEELAKAEDSVGAAELPPIIAREWPSDARTLSSHQEQMWVLHKSGYNSAYNMPAILRLERALDPGALEAALAAFAARHEIIRMHFAHDASGTLVGRVRPAASFVVPLTSLGTVGDVEAALEADAAEEFALESGPLFRATTALGADGAFYLMLIMHHALGDAWSVGVMLRDLAAAYAEALAGRSPALRPLQLQYGDYAAWQREALASPLAAEHRAWWREQLRGAPPLLQLPLDRPRPLHPTMEAGVLTLELGTDLMEALGGLASSLGINTQAVLLAGLQAVLLRYSGQDEVVVGVAAAGRDRLETHDLVGYFISFLPVRCAPPDEACFLDLASAASDAVLAALACAGIVSFDQVVEAARARRMPGVNPLFQVWLQYLPDMDALAVEFAGARAAVSEPTVRQAKLDLHLTIDSQGHLIVRYMSELFDESTVARLAASFRALLAGAAAAPDTPLHRLVLGGEDEAHALFQRCCQGEPRRQYFEEPLLHFGFLRQAGARPGAPCLVFQGAELSYGEVERRVGLLACTLAGLGVRRGTPVGLMLDRSFELVVGLLAILVAGGCYVPCDPGYPDDRLAIYLDDSGVELLLTSRSHEVRAAALAPASRPLKAVVVEEVLLRAPPAGVDVAVLSSVAPDDLCYIEFTSGSTGRPKGVVVRHAGLRDYSCFLRDRFSFGPDDISILTIPINFDPHVVQYSAALYNGGRLVVAEQDQHLDADSLMALVAEQGVTYLNSVPILGRDYFSSPQAQRCTSLRVVMFSGEPLPKDLVDMVFQVTGLPTTNAYGPTEATVNITHATCLPSDPLITIGRIDANAHAYVLDKHMHPVPLGAPGELLLSGPRLAAGYIGRPDLTADKFIPNPCLDLVHGAVSPAMLPHYQRAYRTGDLVRWRPDGAIEYLGRIDRQVKISGVRIELGEVEVALAGAPGVEQAVAAALEDAGGAKRLMGYVTPAAAEPAAVLAHCRGLLVPAMVPSVVVALDAFPLLPNGKVDARALPAPDWSAAGAEEYVAPASELEATVQRVWGEVLGRPADAPLSVTADFFAAGGTSLNAVMVLAGVRKALDIGSLPGTLLYGHPTIRGYAEALAKFMEHAGEETLLVRMARSLGQSTLLLLLPTSSARIEAPAASLSAESLDLATQLPHPVPSTLLPYPCYLALQLVLSSCVAAVVPAAMCGLLLAMLLLRSMAPPLALAAVGPLLYAGMLAWLALLLVAAKVALFPRHMRPGLYPLYGWVYLRWITYRALQDSAMAVLAPHLARTRLLSALFQALGAHIGEDVLLDTTALYEPDLVAIGEGSVLASGSSIAAAFVCPAGFLAPEPCLVFSTARVGRHCTLGRLSTVQPGGRMPNGHATKPYTTLSQPNALVTQQEMEESFPTFYPEQHLDRGAAERSAAASGLVTYLCLVPGAAVAASMLRLCTGVWPFEVPALLVASLQGGAQWPLAVFPLLLILLVRHVLLPLAAWSMNRVVVAYKRLVMGPLSPGLDLLGSDALLLRYSIFRRLLGSPLFSLDGSTVAAMGARIHPTASLSNAVITEPDALSLGAFTTASVAGQLAVQCVAADGVVHCVTVGRAVSLAHTTLFPGALVGDGCAIGNETCIPAGATVPAHHQVQGGMQYRMGGPREADALPAVHPSHLQPGFFSFVTPLLATAVGASWAVVELLATWGPVMGLLAAAVWRIGWQPALVPALLGAIPAAKLLNAALLTAWINIVGWSLDMRAAAPDGGSGTLAGMRMGLGVQAVTSFSAAWECFAGTPLYSWAHRMAGADIHHSALLFSRLSYELHLISVGAGAVLGFGAKVVPHFVRGNTVSWRRVRVGEGCWVQGPSRLLTPAVIEAQSRIFPGTTALPGEEIRKKSVWAGCPASPVGTVKLRAAE